jgi:hypothetical protein
MNNTFKAFFFQDILNSQKKIIFFLLICACAVRGIVLVTTENHYGLDPLGRLYETLLMFKNCNILPPSACWLPLHFYLMGFSLLIWNNIFIAPRILHLIFGVLSVIVFYLMNTYFFGKRIAFYSSLILIFFPWHVILSVLTLSEIPFLLFILLALYFLYRFKKDLKRRLLFLFISAFMLACASLMRYDGWALSLFFIFFLLFSEEKQLFKKMIFVFIVLSTPALWIIWNYIDMSNPFNFLHEHLLNIKGASFPLKEERVNAINFFSSVLFNDFNFFIFLLLIGLFASLIFKKNKFLAIFLIFWFAIIVISYVFGKLAAHPIYLANIEILLLPFIISWVEYIPLQVAKFKKILISGLAFISIFVFFPDLTFRIEGLRINPDYKIIAQEIGEKCKEYENICILIYNNDQERIYDSLLIYYLLEVFTNSKINYYYFDSLKELKEYISKHKPDFIVYYKHSLLDLPRLKKEIPHFFEKNFIITTDYIIFKREIGKS